ncbi:putative Ig domain-containing protein, partial [Flavobacterium sp.]|uniref:putative Ig domain-containing protein n=1 Tax=Flavobacterium sp. TaxID=239 RepID=UPI0037BFBE73
VAAAIADQRVDEDTAWSYTVPAGTFSDADGDALSYTVTLTGSALLPDWLRFDGVTRTFTGTPPENFNGDVSLTVTATDGALSVSDTFVLTVNPVEDEATGTLAVAGTVAEGGVVTADLSASDVDGAITATSYQWQISANGSDGWTDISGATGSSYEIASDQSQVGKYLRAVATTNDAVGGTTSFTSVASAAIANVNDASLGVLRLAKAPELVQEFAINTYLGGTQENASVTALGDGGWLVAWMSLDQDGSGWGVYGQRYSSAGKQVGTEFRVNSFTANNQEYPSVAALADGGWIVTWHSGVAPWLPEGQDGSSFGVYGQRYDSMGQAQGTEFLINSYTFGYQYKPSVASLVDGGWVVLWVSSQDSSYESVHGQRYDANGNAVGNEFQVNTYEQYWQNVPVVVGLEDGGWLAVWESYDQDGSYFGIYGQRFDSFGNTVGGEFQVNTSTINSQEHPSVTALVDGGWVVTWMSDDGASWGISGQRYNSAGLAIGGEFRVNSFTANTQAFPSVTSLSDGGWLVTWQSDGQDGSSSGIYGQRYSNEGSPVGGEFQVNTTTAGAEALPSVATLADGGWLVAWSNGEIYGQRYDAQGNKVGVYGTASTEATLSDFVQGNVLHADAGQISDADGIGSFAWQWQRSSDGGLTWPDIAGATEANYVLLQSDVGQLVRLKGTYTDGQGAIETVYSAASAPIANVNDAPVVAAAIADQSVNEDTAWSYTVPAGTFRDIDGDTLTYTATLGDGSPLPSWLSFDAATLTFSGTPTPNFNGDIAISVKASDGTLSVSDTFTLTVTGVPGLIIDGTAGGDVINGGAGDDTINGYAGQDAINGNAGDDTIFGGTEGDSLLGGDGNDIIYGGDGDDYLDGNLGNDVLDGGAGNDRLFRAGYADLGGADTLRGGAGNDRILSDGYIAPFETVYIEAGSGDDYVETSNFFSDGLTNIDLGEGNDTIRYYTSTVSSLTLGSGVDNILIQRIRDNISFTVTDFQAGSQGDRFNLLEVVDGELIGWDRSTNPFGASGYFKLAQSGADTLLQVDRDGSANGESFATFATLQNVAASQLDAFNFGGFNPDGSPALGQSIDGTDGSEVVYGTAGGDTINGNAGDDTVYGYAGDDVIYGGAGNDEIIGGNGNNVLDGGDGN